MKALCTHAYGHARRMHVCMCRPTDEKVIDLCVYVIVSFCFFVFFFAIQVYL